MNPTPRFLEALRAHGIEPKQKGHGWEARCPAHEDRKPSMTITTGDDGRALVYCHADKGCTIEAITAAVGLKPADLFADAPAAPRRRTDRTDTDTTPRIPARNVGSVSVSNVSDTPTFPTAAAAVAALERMHGKRSALWTYRDAQGDPVGVVARWDTPKGKVIRPASKNCTGWKLGGMDEPRPLYRLPELLARGGERVYIVEGEKSADAATACGLLCTTSPHGSKSAGKADWTPLAGRDIVILPDHDEPGEAYAADVAKLATKAGASSVRVVRLVDLWPDMPDGGDIADLLESRGGDATCLLDEIETLVDAASPVTIEPDETPGPRPEPSKWTPFPVKALPAGMREYVRDNAKAMGCDPSFVALPALAAAAGAIGNTCRVLLNSTWSEPAILWVCPVGESGTLKSPAYKAAIRHLRRAQQKAIEEHTRVLAEYETEKIRHERDKAKWKENGCVGDAPVAPEPPVLRRLIVGDVTMEALAPILLGNPRGVTLARDELAAMIGGFDRYASGKGSDAANWLSVYDGEAICNDRKSGTPPTIYVPAAVVSIVGTTQPGTFTRLFTIEHRESGFLPRFLLAMPPTKPALWTDAEVSEAVEKRYEAMLDNLLALVPGVDDEGKPRPRMIRLTDAARAEFVEWHDTHAREMAELTGDLSAAYSKLKGACARLALVIHCCRVATHDATLDDPARIDLDTVQSAIELTQWFKREASRVYAIFGETDGDKATRQLADLIRRKGGIVTPRDLMRSGPCFKSADEAEDALEGLVKAGVGEWEAIPQSPKGGRPTRRFRLTDIDTTTENHGESWGSVSVSSVSEGGEA